MMQTPSLRRRVVALGVIVVVVVLPTVNGLLYLAFRAELLDNLDGVLRERAELVRGEASTRSGSDLASRLTELGLRVTIRSPDGTVYHSAPPSPVVGRNLPRGDPRSGAPAVSRDVPLADGSVATVFANRSGVDDAGRK
ncbi:MAG: hypothetical protein LC808_43405, partial [Actinobacteria bacterium]|nr:hypothetical protein [Actinomycetota bacterium]